MGSRTSTGWGGGGVLVLYGKSTEFALYPEIVIDPRHWHREWEVTSVYACNVYYGYGYIHTSGVWLTSYHT